MTPARVYARNMIIADVLNKKPLKNPEQIIACSDRDSVLDAVARLAEHNIGAVVVMSEHSVAGIFTERDVVAGVAARGAGFLATPLAEAMTVQVVVVGPSQSVDAALGLMLERKIRHLPVVDGDTLVGMLSMRDLALQQLDAVEQTVEFLKKQVHLGSQPLPM